MPTQAVNSPGKAGMRWEYSHYAVSPERNTPISVLSFASTSGGADFVDFAWARISPFAGGFPLKKWERKKSFRMEFE